jgi:hypothetical protein
VQTLFRPGPNSRFDDEPQVSFLTELLFPLPAHRRTTLGIVIWWESRRLLFNVIVGTTGLVTLAVILVADLVAPGQTDRALSLSPALFPVVAYGVLANVCYTLGPIVEATLERVWKDQILPIGPALFRQGLAFSVGLTLLPIPLVICVEMARLFSVLFLHR